MDETRNITVKIAGRDYCLKVKNADEEELYRLAADSVNRKIDLYRKKFVGRQETDILSFVAFNVCLANIRSVRKYERLGKEAEEMHRQIESYLEDIGND